MNESEGRHISVLKDTAAPLRSFHKYDQRDRNSTTIYFKMHFFLIFIQELKRYVEMLQEQKVDRDEVLDGLRDKVS